MKEGKSFFFRVVSLFTLFDVVVVAAKFFLGNVAGVIRDVWSPKLALNNCWSNFRVEANHLLQFLVLLFMFFPTNTGPSNLFKAASEQLLDFYKKLWFTCQKYSRRC